MNFLTRSLVALYLYTAPFSAAALPNVETQDLNQALAHLVTEHRDNLGLVGLGAMVMQGAC